MQTISFYWFESIESDSCSCVVILEQLIAPTCWIFFLYAFSIKHVSAWSICGPNSTVHRQSVTESGAIYWTQFRCEIVCVTVWFYRNNPATNGIHRTRNEHSRFHSVRLSFHHSSPITYKSLIKSTILFLHTTTQGTSHTHGIRLKKSLRATSHQSHWISFRVYFWGTPTVCAIRSFVVCSVWFSIFLPLYRYCDFFVVVACFTSLASYSENFVNIVCALEFPISNSCAHTHTYTRCALFDVREFVIRP